MLLLLVVVVIACSYCGERGVVTLSSAPLSLAGSCTTLRHLPYLSLCFKACGVASGAHVGVWRDKPCQNTVKMGRNHTFEHPRWCGIIFFTWSFFNCFGPFLWPQRPPKGPKLGTWGQNGFKWAEHTLGANIYMCLYFMSLDSSVIVGRHPMCAWGWLDSCKPAYPNVHA